MIVFLNGRFVPEEQATVSLLDRGFLFGDGLFETLRLSNGRPFRWEAHLERFHAGAAFLGLTRPLDSARLRDHVSELARQNRMPEALLRMVLSRGVGPRGYSPRDAGPSTMALSLHPVPVLEPGRLPGWRLATSSLRLPAGDPLARFKTCNKLRHILARAEAEAAGADEALLLNTDGAVAEAASANLFCLQGSHLLTPPPASGILPGITRSVLLELAPQLGLEPQEAEIHPDQLRKADGLFLSLSSWGLVEVCALDGQSVPRSPLTVRLQTAYTQRVRQECGLEDGGSGATGAG